MKKFVREQAELHKRDLKKIFIALEKKRLQQQSPNVAHKERMTDAQAIKLTSRTYIKEFLDAEDSRAGTQSAMTLSSIHANALAENHLPSNVAPGGNQEYERAQIRLGSAEDAPGPESHDFGTSALQVYIETAREMREKVLAGTLVQPKTRFNLQKGKDVRVYFCYAVAPDGKECGLEKTPSTYPKFESFTWCPIAHPDHAAWMRSEMEAKKTAAVK
uniref:Uncharacterized protein n=1 Tax=Chromera velia CCMP2878 TaxID=1169474 RepID=A0A0G4IC54_9ALVE|eukprot:Cvel_12935.t1-p1 / transcript=Cvel_12935.t1 / gene=Cvel_12935 / organism=Chromera_velia_CCMP2878 / gene_product=hypothetical protein / transcript_product=hypothetical protein / location=Cvel_scaffold865:31954-32766(+) / protein_length=216 / sequence_SO=supercontig / SO=protein_coding / is_pseudo=false